MSENTSPHFAITEMDTTWSCLPSSGRIRFLMGWGIRFCLFAAIIFPVGVWYLLGHEYFRPMAVLLIIGGWLLMGVLGWVIYGLWQQRNVPLKADRNRGLLLFGEQGAVQAGPDRRDYGL